MNKNLVLTMTALFLIIFALGCTSADVKVGSGDNISVKYAAKYENGTVFDSSEDGVLTFVVGSGQVIKGFDYAVIGMKEGESKTVTIQPEDGYGKWTKDMVMTENVTALKDAGYPAKKGTVVGMTVGENALKGVITDVNSTHAVIDFNHALAGKIIVFDITISKINEKGSSLYK
jgi:FKBP-type peptidyl-prolyl cis-trans isomerase 2